MIPENSYALVTGACGGLGRAFSAECARMGMHLVLVDLPGKGLEKLSLYLQENFLVETVVIAADISTLAGCNRVFAECRSKNLPLSILINNAAVGGTFLFQERTADFYQQQVTLNVLAPILLIRLFLDQFKNSPGPTYILNIASMAGFFPLPGKQVYGASKSFIISFTRSLRLELEEHGIHLSVLCPGGINTTLQQVLMHRKCGRISRLTILQPEQVARQALRRMLQGQEVIVPGLCNRLLLYLRKLIPASLTKKLKARQMRSLMGGFSIHQA